MKLKKELEASLELRFKQEDKLKSQTLMIEKFHTQIEDHRYILSIEHGQLEDMKSLYEEAKNQILLLEEEKKDTSVAMF